MGDSATGREYAWVFTDNAKLDIRNGYPWFQLEGIHNPGVYNFNEVSERPAKLQFSGRYYVSIGGSINILAIDTVNHEFTARLALTLVDSISGDTLSLEGFFDGAELVSLGQLTKSNIYGYSPDLGILDSTGLHLSAWTTNGSCMSDVKYEHIEIELAEPSIGSFSASANASWQKIIRHQAVRCPKQPDEVTRPLSSDSLVVTAMDTQRRTISGYFDLSGHRRTFTDFTWRVAR